MLGPGFIQIGTEGGYLPQPVLLKGADPTELLMAPAERADVLIDFSTVAPGTEFILYNDAPGPYPGGAKIFDYYPGNGKTPWSDPRIRPQHPDPDEVQSHGGNGAVTPLPAKINTDIAEPERPAARHPDARCADADPALARYERTLTLNEGFDEYGRLAQYLGPDTTPAGALPGFYGRKYEDTPTETVTKGSVEVWQIANLTADAHPIHFHLSNVQILYRQAISMKGLGGTFTINPMGKPVAPDDNELGYKETVRMNPGEVTVVIMKFDIPPNPPNVASYPGKPKDGRRRVRLALPHPGARRARHDEAPRRHSEEAQSRRY